MPMRPYSLEYEATTPRCTDIGSSRVAIWNWLLNARTPVPGSTGGRLAASTTSK